MKFGTLRIAKSTVILDVYFKNQNIILINLFPAPAQARHYQSSKVNVEDSLQQNSIDIQQNITDFQQNSTDFQLNSIDFHQNI